MKYVLYNIRGLVKHEKFIFAVMIVCIFVSAWIMTFSYGLYQNYFSLRIEGEANSKKVQPNIAEGETLTYGELKTYFDSLSDELLNGVNVVVCNSTYQYENSSTPGDVLGTTVFSRFTIHNGDYQASSYITEIWNDNIMTTGRFLSDSDEMFGKAYVLVKQDELTRPSLREDNKNLIIDDDTAMIFGKEYNIVGTHKSIGLIVPFLSVPAQTPVNTVSISFEKIMTRKIYEELVSRASDVIPGKLVFPEFDLPDSDSIYIYNNIMMISVLIAILTIVNFAFLYNFIFSKRRRQLAVMRICGCTTARALGICLAECCLICVPVFLVGMLTYIPFMHSVLTGYFEYMEDSYSPWIYVAIFGIYFLTLIVIMAIFLSMQIGKTLAEAQKEGVE